MSIINSITGKPVRDPKIAELLAEPYKSPTSGMTEEEKQKYFKQAAEEAKKSNEGTITRLKDEVYN